MASETIMDSVRGDPAPVRSLSLLLAGAVLVAGVVIAGALLVLALHRSPQFRPAGAVGSLQTVTLTGGQVYFGRMTAVHRSSIVLSDVYEAVTSTDPTSRQQITRLVSRRLADWHGPLDMTIPDDRIAFIETVGPESSVGKAIAAAALPKPVMTPPAAESPPTQDHPPAQAAPPGQTQTAPPAQAQAVPAGQTQGPATSPEKTGDSPTH